MNEVTWSEVSNSKPKESNQICFCEYFTHNFQKNKKKMINYFSLWAIYFAKKRVSLRLKHF